MDNTRDKNTDFNNTINQTHLSDTTENALPQAKYTCFSSKHAALTKTDQIRC